jgi:hypothetical protein
MAYNGKKTFNDFEREAGNIGNNLITAIKRGEELYQDLAAYRGVQTNSDIAAALSVDVTWIDDLETAVTAMHRIHDQADNLIVAQGNYFNDIRLFT